jgi:hypothetical protein
MWTPVPVWKLLGTHAEKRMNWNLPVYIPQCLDEPIGAARLEYKASTGSFKATDYLRSLLEFAAIAILGGGPFNELSSDELENTLSREYVDIINDGENPVHMAFKWAWPPIQGNLTIFDYTELMMAVEALCALIEARISELSILNLVSYYDEEEAEETEYAELGKSIGFIGAPRSFIEKLSPNEHVKTMLAGYDSVMTS